MISAFRIGPAVSGRGLCDIDRVQLGVPRKNIKNLGSPCKADLNRFLVKRENSNYRSNLSVLGLPNFLKILFDIYFSEVPLTLVYRYHTVCVRLLPNSYEMPKSWNLPHLQAMLVTESLFKCHQKLELVTIKFCHQHRCNRLNLKTSLWKVCNEK